MQKDNTVIPIFIIGVPRSGTTLLRVILDSHPEIAAAPETPWILGSYGPHVSLKKLHEVLTKDPTGPVNNLAGIDDQTLLQAARSYVSTIGHKYLESRNKEILIFKTPDDIRFIEFLFELYPSSKFIHVCRDGRDVAVSTMKHKDDLWNDNSRNNYGEIGYMSVIKRWWSWEKKIRSLLHEKSSYGYITFKYEDIVNSPEESITKACDFIGVEYTPAMLNYNSEEHEYPEWEAGSNDVKGKNNINSSSIGLWKENIPVNIRMKIEEIYGDYLKKLGYEHDELAKEAFGIEAVDKIQNTMRGNSEKIAGLTKILNEKKSELNNYISKMETKSNSGNEESSPEEEKAAVTEIEEFANTLNTFIKTVADNFSSMQDNTGKIEELDEKLNNLGKGLEDPEKLIEEIDKRIDARTSRFVQDNLKKVNRNKKQIEEFSAKLDNISSMLSEQKRMFSEMSKNFITKDEMIENVKSAHESVKRELSAETDGKFTEIEYQIGNLIETGKETKDKEFSILEKLDQLSGISNRQLEEINRMKEDLDRMKNSKLFKLFKLSNK